jgi:two-component system, LytTR family, sensor histidine kinase AlgZ
VWAYWLCQLFGWGLNTVGQTITAMSRDNAGPTWRIVFEVVSINVIALLLTHLVRGYIKRHRWDTLRIAPLVPRVLVASFALGFPIAVIMSFMSIAMMWGGGPEDQETIAQLAGKPGLWLASMDLLLRTLNWSAAFAFWMGLYFGITSVRDRQRAVLRQSELAHALKVAELRVLKSQLNPHFLFNSLNSVRALIADDPKGAQNAVTQLARTLRYTLTAGQEEVVSLERELEIVADYLQLEALRLGDRLHIERTIALEARVAHIPVMLLQTVVENAIKHGIAELPEGGVLRISADVRDGALIIEVENPRPATPSQSPSHGVGLRNAAERLRLLFGAAGSLDLDLSDPARALARIRIPQGHAV